MHRICPLPKAWILVHRELDKFAKAKGIAQPPTPLILGGWHFSSDAQKNSRWNDTVTWARKHGVEHLLENIKDEHFYEVTEFTYPKEWNWSLESIRPAVRPSDEQLESYLRLIQKNWKILAKGFSQQTFPVSFSGKKARTLSVKLLTAEPLPPWGTWGLEKVGLHSQKFTQRVKFTVFRKTINLLITPHKVDHIKFFCLIQKSLPRKE